MYNKAFMVLDYPVDRYSTESSFRNEVEASTLHYAAGLKRALYMEKKTPLFCLACGPQSGQINEL